MGKLRYFFIIWAIILFSCGDGYKSTDTNSEIIIHELNEAEIPKGDKVIALVGATLIDGNGGDPVENSCVLIRNDQIEFAGRAGDIKIEAEKYKQLIMADNSARDRGRYESWNSLKLENNPVVDSLIQFLEDKQTFVCPTLAFFERQADKGDSIEVNGFRNMVKFVELANKGGARIVVGSHTWVSYAALGFAYFREMELLQDAGLSTLEIIQAATIENARFLRIDERLGSLEAGKLADLILVEGDPLADIKAMRNVRRVMLNGVWVGE